MRPTTVFLDIDGTLLKHHGSLSLIGIMPPVLLDGVHEKLDEWDKKGYRIILITGRKESMRELTENHLKMVGINYDRLIMGIGNGPRVLINDAHEDQEMAFGITIERNKGLKNIQI
jgi:predicted mannosyl-3-phosphoglycerate phosphatase (HAD superfamily)